MDFTAEIMELDPNNEEAGSMYSKEICVKECPAEINSREDIYQEYINKGNLLCDVNYDLMQTDFEATVLRKQARVWKK